MKIAYPYLRFSTTRQGGGNSERRQTTWHEETARREGWNLDYSFRLEDKGKSAFHGDHLKADLGRFLEAVNSGRVKPGSVFMFEEFDRFSRQGLGKAFSLFVGILTAGVEIRTREAHYTEESLDDLGAMVGVMVKQKGANDESKKKSERIGENWAAWRAEVAAGVKSPPPGTLPGWLRWVGWTKIGNRKKGGHVELDPARAAVVKLIYRWAAEGLGVPRIVAKLNEPGAKVPVVGRKGTWRVSYVNKILADRAVLGDVRYRDEDGAHVVAGFYPAAVTQDEWDAARGARAGRQVGRKGVGRTGGKKGSGEISNLLTGLVYDATDGELMHQHVYPYGKGKVRRALVSAGALRGQEGSVFRMTPYLLVEGAVLKFVGGLAPDDLSGGGADGAARLAVLDGKAADLKGRIKKAKARADEGGDDLDDVLDLLTKWRGQLREVEKEQEALRAKAANDATAALEEAQAMILTYDRHATAKGDERAELRAKLKLRIRQVIEAIYLSGWDVDQTVRAATLQVKLRNGAVRVVGIAWCVGGAWPGLSIGYAFDGDGALRDVGGGWSEEVRAGVRRAIEEEIRWRRELLAADREDGKDTLGVYLRGTLDGLRPPKRTGRPRKAPAAATAG